MIHPTAKVSEQVNRKCPPRNTILPLSTHSIDPEPSNSPLPNDGHHASKQSWITSKADFSLKL